MCDDPPHGRGAPVDAHGSAGGGVPPAAHARCLLLRTELSEPWALEMPAFADTVSFHLVTQGSCYLDVTGNDAVELRGATWRWSPTARATSYRADPTPAHRPRSILSLSATSASTTRC